MDFQNIKEVAVYGMDFVVDITRGDDETCRFISAKEKYFAVQADNGALTVTQKSNNLLYRIIMRKLEFKLILPKSFNGRLRFRNKNGGLYIKGGTFGEIDLSTKNGKFDVEGIKCAEFSLKMKNGNASLKNTTATDDVNIKCSNGSIRAESLVVPSLVMSCRNAAGFSAIDIKADKLDCSTDNGTIDASGIDCPDVKLETSNGGVNALCLGLRDDYRLSLETTHGSITLNGTPAKNVTDPVGAKKRIIARTSNGDIDLKFM